MGYYDYIDYSPREKPLHPNLETYPAWMVLIFAHSVSILAIFTGAG